ncbi:unnamed protein product [Paramecium octaurelia]|uniref:Uncharacterized protein n=1 Tax=Paramecium octaurelia TaxID=43137 RepID=A0A8S1V780_PAROT|nr:unnamed protein product [Paramecium octaurelia]
MMKNNQNIEQGLHPYHQQYIKLHRILHFSKKLSQSEELHFIYQMICSSSTFIYTLLSLTNPQEFIIFFCQCTTFRQI